MKSTKAKKFRPSTHRLPQLDLFEDRPPSTELVSIRSEPILRDWRLRCEKVFKKLSAVSEKLRCYHEVAGSAYHAWIEREFRIELSVIADLNDRLGELEAIQHAVEAEAVIRGRGYPAAYSAVMARKALGKDLFPDEFDDFLRAQEGEGPMDSEWEEAWAEVDPFTDYRNEEPSNDESANRSNRSLFQGAKDSLSPSESEKLRTIYRKLVFALHPDVNPGLCARKQVLWSEVQSAYQVKDLTTLELLLIEVESGEGFSFKNINHISLLQDLFNSRSRELKNAETAFRRIRKDPAWTFWVAEGNESTLSSLRKSLNESFLEEVLHFKKSIEHYENRFKKWATGRGKTRGPKKRKALRSR